MSKVIVEVSGGVAQVTSNPDGVQVEIVDWDDINERIAEIGDELYSIIKSDLSQ